MDMMQAAVFLSGAILTMLGFVTIVIGIVLVNNIIHKYWKPIKILRFEEYPPRLIAEPTLNELDKNKDVK